MMIKRLCQITVLVTLVAGSVVRGRPNILFIAIDDLNDWPACLGNHPQAQTPNIDRLAAQGTLFTRAHCQYPLCGPSRASLMSGMRPTTLGFKTHMKDRALAERVTALGSQLLHSRLREQGYKTMAVGKICHHHVPEGSVDLSGGRGPFGPKNQYVWHQNGTSTDWGAFPDRDEAMPDYDAAQWAVARLREQHDQPFLLMVGFLRPHVPWYVPQPWLDRFPEPKALQTPAYLPEDWDDIPGFARTIATSPVYPTTSWARENDCWHDIIQAYLACVLFVDHYVGQVVEALESSPYRDNTIIVLWSDHGYHLGEKGLFKKITLWERSSHVPLIITGPGLKAGQRCARVVSLLDLYPTLLDLCDLPANPKNEGHSLVPLLRDPERPWAHSAITTLQGENHAVNSERYRYIRYEDGAEELYDHKLDPHEWRNLAKDPRHAHIKTELARHLQGITYKTPP